MSRNKGEEEEELIARRVCILEKATPLKRETLTREGMSDCKLFVIGNTFQRDDTRIMK